VVGEPLPLGGWDLANRKPKPMQKAVPAGGTYYFALEQGSAEEIIEHFHGKGFGQQGEAGYGYIVVGSW
jgi:CRISPR-associated protein Cmr3